MRYNQPGRGPRPVAPASPTFRCFVALPVSQEVKDLFSSFVARAGERFPGYRFGSPENLHITVQFLGEVPRKMTGALRESLARAAEGVKPFSVGCSEAGTFPERGTPRILHVKVDRGTDNLNHLASRVRANLKSLGYLDSSEFKPHITLGRERKPGGLAPQRGSAVSGGPISNIRSTWQDSYRQFLEEVRGRAEWEIGEILLMESVLGRQGPTYTPVGRAELA